MHHPPTRLPPTGLILCSALVKCKLSHAASPFPAPSHRHASFGSQALQLYFEVKSRDPEQICTIKSKSSFIQFVIEY
ncbi:hypothetical protein E2C01_014686 [Portunus trituberculatus]|uniref:Secreted protein n=1 Tax=Portunus trituberculatus TaxID=210409 RepID=A0A5B7DKN6_PORTR|nr:hypothetical protein [Portunus trituberculatus]